MARKYRKHKKQTEDPIASGIVLLVLLGGVLLWQQTHDNPLLLTLLIASVVLILAGVAGFIIWKYQRNQQKLRALDIAAIDTMDPLKFEEYVAKLLKHQGYTNVTLTEKFDYGVDIIAHKDGIRWGVQVKRYSSIVKAEAVRQVFTALVRYRCDRAMVVTNNIFSRPAGELAADNNCVLINREQLTEWIVKFQAPPDQSTPHTS